MLFSLYINDISADIESEIRLFADDCVCYREIKNEEDTLKLQRDIDRLGSWARKWGMRFQPVKCNKMQLTNKRSSKIQANYTLEGTILENVESIKYLGVTITNDLKWTTHISYVCTKANRTLRFLRRNLYSSISCSPDHTCDISRLIVNLPIFLSLFCRPGIGTKNPTKKKSRFSPTNDLCILPEKIE